MDVLGGLGTLAVAFSGGSSVVVLSYLVTRNSEHFCTAVTDEAGRFTLANFAAPDQPWYVAAGN